METSFLSFVDVFSPSFFKKRKENHKDEAEICTNFTRSFSNTSEDVILQPQKQKKRGKKTNELTHLKS